MSSQRIQGSDSIALKKSYRLASPREASAVKALIFFLAFSFISFWLTGCQSSNIHDVNVAYTSVRKIVVSNLPGGIKEESLNGRELTSGYFSATNWDDDATDKPDRAYAKVTILNSGRPYDLDVEVYRERRTHGTHYKSLGMDKKLTRELIKRIKESLADRREDRSIIEDFRAF